MKTKLINIFKKSVKPLIFVAAGVIVGVAYYYLVVCESGSCPLKSSQWMTGAYVGLIGLLVSGIFSKSGGDSDKCNM